jgi:hydrogenase maturation protease
MNVRIVGLGSDYGDDRVGFAALQALAGRRLPDDCELHTCANPATELLTLLAGTQHAILIDAIVDGGAPGRVLRCASGELAPTSARASSHGVSVDAVLDLAAALGVLPAVSLFGVTIGEDHDLHGGDLSPAVQAALPALLDQVLAAAAAEMRS